MSDWDERVEKVDQDLRVLEETYSIGEKMNGIEFIPAGKKMDTLVHEHVMGSPPGDVPPYSTNKEEALKAFWHLFDLGQEIVDKFMDIAPQSFHAQEIKRGEKISHVGEDASPLEICQLALIAVGWAKDGQIQRG